MASNSAAATPRWSSKKICTIISFNKKVLLRERKRHAAHRVASPSGGTYLGWGVPTLARGCLPWLGVLTLARAYLPWLGIWYLPWSEGYLLWLSEGLSTLAGGTYLPRPWHTYLGCGDGTYLGRGVPTSAGWGGIYLSWEYLPWLGRYLPWLGVPTWVRGTYLSWVRGTYLGWEYLPRWVGTYLGQGVPTLGYPPSWPGGYPPAKVGNRGQGRYPPSWPGTSHWGIPTPILTTDQSLGYPQKDMGLVEVLWDGDGVPPERTWDQWKYYGIEMGYLPGC